MRVRRVLLVTKKTAYAMLRGAHRFEETADLRIAHEEHKLSLRMVRQALKMRDIEVDEHVVGRPLPQNGHDLVITVGGDGTLLEASHTVRNKTPVLGVNSAPTFSVGFLTCCRAPTFGDVLDAMISRRVKPMPVHRLAVAIGRKQLKEPVLNDVLFCHESPAQTARYHLASPEGEETQRSSGVWISTAAGSTAALRSAGGLALSLEEERFAFVVREPYAPPGSQVNMTRGTLAKDAVLKITCHLNEARVFIDGAHRQYPVAFGQVVTFRRHRAPLFLVRPVKK